MLWEQIRLSKNGDETSILNLIERFSPLLRKYARKLNYEDSFLDMQLAFIEMLHAVQPYKLNSTSDGAVVKYIQVSMHNAYVKLLKKYIRSSFPAEELDTYTDAQFYKRVKPQKSEPNGSSKPPGVLTKKESYVLHGIYGLGYTAAEIARQNGVTRQNVNQVKKNAMEKLRRAYEEQAQS